MRSTFRKDTPSHTLTHAQQTHTHTHTHAQWEALEELQQLFNICGSVLACTIQTQETPTQWYFVLCVFEVKYTCTAYTHTHTRTYICFHSELNWVAVFHCNCVDGTTQCFRIQTLCQFSDATVKRRNSKTLHWTLNQLWFLSITIVEAYYVYIYVYICICLIGKSSKYHCNCI